jgi:large subunit ribosomal protein L31
MREAIHPNYVEAAVSCACGSSFKTRSTKAVIKLDICSSCHPFFTGRQKFLDTAGRVERFQKRFAKTGGETVKAAKPSKVVKGQQIGMPKKTPIKAIAIPVKTKSAPGAPGANRSPGAKPAGDKNTTKPH